MTDVEEALRAELRDDHYRLDAVSAALTVRLRHRLAARARTRRRLTVVAAAGTVTTAVAAVFVLMSGGPSSTPAGGGPDPAGQATRPSASAGTPRPSAPVAVRGLPAYLTEAPDGRAAMTTGRPLAAMPVQGSVATFTARAAADPVRRVVVVADPEEAIGLPGSVREPAWAIAPALGGIRALVTDHEASATAYLMAFSPTGRRWFLAVTGPDPAARLAVLQSVATATLPGT